MLRGACGGCRCAGSCRWGIDLLDLCRQVEDGVELVAPCRVAAFDGSVDLGPFGREFVEDEALVLAGLLELGLELGSAIDQDGLDAEGHLAEHLVEEVGGCCGGGAAEGLSDGPFGGGIVGGEVLDVAFGPNLYEDRVDLNDAARLVGLEPVEQPLRAWWRRAVKRLVLVTLQAMGTGCATPRATRWAMMRCTVMSEAAKPSSLTSGPILARPDIGWSSHSCFTAWISADGHWRWRT